GQEHEQNAPGDDERRRVGPMRAHRRERADDHRSDRASHARQPAVKPPSTTSSAPVMYDDSSLARNRATPAISRGSARQPSGTPVTNSLRMASVRYGAWSGVSTMPGWMMLPRMRSLAYWM